ncbi:hypothetical protein BKA65DRAFT_478816 [Rhexocercosporidium sp. MPI-PUGE-AT-0058]|nr:hypothetical protein BKA65DRAFT_478816 [Rhexocercosporidium sp. MPI-PUGE-AT-0058]
MDQQPRMDHQLKSASVADQAVIEDVIMSMDPAENPDERVTSIVNPEKSTLENQAIIHQSTIRVPDYQHPKGFFYLVWDVKYGKFVLDVQGMNDQLIDRETMEKLWVEHVYRHYRMDDTGVKAVMEPTLKDALRQVKGYNGFDAEAYWQLQSVTSGLGQLLKDWRKKEEQDDQKNPTEQAADTKKKKGNLVMGTANRSMQKSSPTIRAPSQQFTRQNRHQAAYTPAPAPAYKPYVHPGISRRKIDESYEFDEDGEDTEMA